MAIKEDCKYFEYQLDPSNPEIGGTRDIGNDKWPVCIINKNEKCLGSFCSDNCEYYEMNN